VAVQVVAESLSLTSMLLCRNSPVEVLLLPLSLLRLLRISRAMHGSWKLVILLPPPALVILEEEALIHMAMSAWTMYMITRRVLAMIWLGFCSHLLVYQKVIRQSLSPLVFCSVMF
jgi:hypothetical protein